MRVAISSVSSVMIDSYFCCSSMATEMLLALNAVVGVDGELGECGLIRGVEGEREPAKEVEERDERARDERCKSRNGVNDGEREVRLW